MRRASFTLKNLKRKMKMHDLSAKFSFRSFSETDFPEILILWKLCGMGGKERGDTAQTIQNCNKNGGEFIVLEQLSSGKIIGTSWMTRDGRRVYLHHFCIHPDFRSIGLGTLLGEESLKFIKKWGEQVKLEVYKENKAAKRLYEKLGFFAFRDYDIYMIREVDKI